MPFVELVLPAEVEFTPPELVLPAEAAAAALAAATAAAVLESAGARLMKSALLPRRSERHSSARVSPGANMVRREAGRAYEEALTPDVTAGTASFVEEEKEELPPTTTSWPRSSSTAGQIQPPPAFPPARTCRHVAPSSKLCHTSAAATEVQPGWPPTRNRAEPNAAEPAWRRAPHGAAAH